MKLAKYLIVFLSLSFSTVFAGSMKFFPSTGDMGMYCRNIGNIVADTNSSSVYAIDSKLLSHDIIFSGSLPTLPFGAYGRLGSGGTTLKAVVFPRTSYATGSSYSYTNRYASNLAQLLHSGNALIYSFLFSNIGSQLTGSVDLYFLSGENGDDSNLQSGVVNGMSDILAQVNSGTYTFRPMPCVMDVDGPLFTGYTSGASYDPNTVSGFFFTAYEYSGANIVNYRFQSGSATTGNLANYVRVPSGSGIDNQNGVKSNTITVYFSGLTIISGSNLLAPTTLTSLNCSFAYDGPGYPLTRNRNTRGYTCFVPFSSLSLQADQVVQVVISGADMPNFYGITHTGVASFTLRLSAAFTPPPLIPLVGPGGGPGLKFDNCRLPGSSLPGANYAGIDYSLSYYDQDCEIVAHAAAPSCPIEDESYLTYSEEMVDAFQEAYGLGMTNKCPIEDARLKELLLRKDLVKMLVFFSVKILGIMPDTNKAGCDQYGDMQNASDEMKFYSRIGCQLEVMGMQPDGITPMKNFYPNQKVTRAQFGTTLSRLIFGRRFNGEKPYRYSRHLEALKEFNIIKLVKPDLKETRGFVLIIFKRTRESGLVEQFRLSAAAKNGAIAIQ